MVQRAIAPTENSEDERFDRLFRPTSLSEYIGQEKHKENLRIFVEAARRRGEPLDHILFCGPPGLGKTTLASILAREMGVSLHVTSGPAIEHKGALAGLLTKLEANDVLFVDEIHRLSPVVEESLYPAIESFQISQADYREARKVPSGPQQSDRFERGLRVPGSGYLGVLLRDRGLGVGSWQDVEVRFDLCERGLCEFDLHDLAEHSRSGDLD